MPSARDSRASHRDAVARPVALVTGGAGGLGRAITGRLLQDGFRVAVVDLFGGQPSSSGTAGCAVDAEDAAALRPRSGVAPVPTAVGPASRVLEVRADITDEEQVQRAVAAVEARWGRLDALINNAGIEPAHGVVTTDVSVWDRVFALNVRAPMVLVKHAVPLFERQGSGTVVSIGSRTWLSGSSSTSYVASKAALVGLTRALAAELGPMGVTANVVAPSFVRTPLNAQKGDADYVGDYAARFAAASPLGRLIEPEDVAHCVAFLVSAGARSITGEVIHVAAGTQLAPAVR